MAGTFILLSVLRTNTPSCIDRTMALLISASRPELKEWGEQRKARQNNITGSGKGMIMVKTGNEEHRNERKIKQRVIGRMEGGIMFRYVKQRQRCLRV